MFRDPIFSNSQQAADVKPAWLELGFKFGNKGTHTSRTIMLDDLSSLLRQCPATAARSDYVRALVVENCLGKQTLSTRKLTLQRLKELYGLDPVVPIFRLLRVFWDADEKAHPQLALLAALARDPLLRVTAPVIYKMKPDDELARQQMTDTLTKAVGGRLNEATLDKVVRNTASSWTQSGHLVGRSRKRRVRISPTSASTAFALLLGFLMGNRGQNLFQTLFIRALDRGPDELMILAMGAKRLGFLDMKSTGGLTVISFDCILSKKEKELSNGAH